MESKISQCDAFTIYLLGANCIRALADFTVRVNHSHHKSNAQSYEITDDINAICAEEHEMHLLHSTAYMARDNNHTPVGTIRVGMWNGKTQLPIEKIFGINPAEMVTNKKSNIWHIGRFAINSFLGIPTLGLFKHFMRLALNPIFESHTNDCFVAEIDAKLNRIINAMGISTTTLGSPVDYLGSSTLPIMAYRDAITNFCQSTKIQS